MEKLIGLLTATKSEEDAVREVLEQPELCGEGAGLTFVRGRLGGRPVVTVRAGIGKVNAALCTQMLIDRFQPAGIINVGAAGALNPSLHIGDVVISRSAVQHDFDTTFFGDEPGLIPGLNLVQISADETLAAAAEEACRQSGIPCCPGVIASGDQFIAGEEEKKRIREQFGGDCTEMEGGAVAQVCRLNGVPFVILRAISDGAGQDAVMQYEEFSALAARQAVKILKYMLSHGENL